jgi:DNA polymerase III alpha subunit (gram-positive type)
MIICAVDLECTGLNLNNDRILEVGLALYSTGRERVFECTSFLVNTDGVKVTDEITDITGATQDLVDAFGYSQESAVETINEYFAQANAVIGHNSTWYDLPMIRNAAKRTNLDLALPKLSIDTMVDVPGVKGEKLITMCANAKDPKTGRDVGFAYTKHSALDDAKAVIRLISWHDIDKIVERAINPMLVILSQQGRDKAANKAARKAGFRWNGDFKIWWQAVKEMDVQTLANRVPFAIAVAPKEITLEQLRDD